MFIDKVVIKIESGKGGNGTVSWRREKFVPMGGPAGGDGGVGGSIYLVPDDQLSTLLDFKYKSIFKADNGENGRNKSRHGKSGKDLKIRVPAGTIVRDLATGKIIADINNEGTEEEFLVAEGGRGGRGNARFSSSTRQSPQFCEPGEAGITRELELELKLIADVGIIGMPNAGKSTFISSVSSAKPKIADYPFTTLKPNLGVVKKPNGDGFVLADIPGLIEGASEGLGLGHEFLRHIERNRILLHFVDVTVENPLENYKIINNELKNYSEELAKKPQILVLNKIDAVDETKLGEIKEEFDIEPIFAISSVSKINTQELINFVAEKLETLPLTKLNIEVEEDFDAYSHDDSDFVVYREKKEFFVQGGKVARLVQVTNFRNFEATLRFENILKSMGIYEALKKAGIKDGQTINIEGVEFDYRDDGSER